MALSGHAQPRARSERRQSRPTPVRARKSLKKYVLRRWKALPIQRHSPNAAPTKSLVRPTRADGISNNLKMSHPEVTPSDSCRPEILQHRESFYFEGGIKNSYVAERIGAGEDAEWRTRSVLAPASLIALPSLLTSLVADFPADLTSGETECGGPPRGQFACAERTGTGGARAPITGASKDSITTARARKLTSANRRALNGSCSCRGVPLLPQDRLGLGGLYELSGLKGGAPTLRRQRVARGTGASQWTSPNRAKRPCSVVSARDRPGARKATIESAEPPTTR